MHKVVTALVVTGIYFSSEEFRSKCVGGRLAAADVFKGGKVCGANHWNWKEDGLGNVKDDGVGNVNEAG